MIKLDILAFGVHPDDTELGCGGVLALEKSKGKKTGIVDLTRGELGTRGTAETRDQEAADAAQVLQLDARENLELKDGFFQNDESSQRAVIRMIRKYRPEIVICNAPEDRHPDHGRSAALVYDATFLSGLAKIETELDGKAQEKWRPKYLLNYIQDRYLQPDFVVDITGAMDIKMEAVKAYKTQFFNAESQEPQTYISSPEFLELIESRAAMMGRQIGVKFGEGFVTKKMTGIKSIFDLVLRDT